MLTNKQLCTHLESILHTTVRIYHASGERIEAKPGVEKLPDPLVCDPEFEALLLSRRTPDYPVLHFEYSYVIYSIVPAKNGTTYIVGPNCIDTQVNAVSRTVAKAHRIPSRSSYHIAYQPMDCFLEVTLLLFHFVSDKFLTCHTLLEKNALSRDIQRDANQNSFHIAYKNREEGSHHNPYSQEQMEQGAIRNGSEEALRQSWEISYSGKIGTLGPTPLRHFRNLAITNIAISCRSAIEGGVLPELAYTYSDSYTCRVEELTDFSDIIGLYHSAELQYTQLVKESQDTTHKNKIIGQCKTLIFNRLHQRITAKELAKELEVNYTYLSQLFVKETGMKLTAYIAREKINASKTHLLYTEDSIEQIASLYGFSSQSHFGQVFKKQTGRTPREYRNYYRQYRDEH